MADQDASDLHFDAMTSRPLRREALRRKTSSYSRSNMVVKAGWATVGAETSPDNAVARACSDKLSIAKTG